MATSEEYKIILRVEGEDRLAKLTQEVAKEEKALADLAARLRAINTPQAQVISATAVYAQNIALLNKEIAATQKQIAEAGGRMQGMANGLVQLGYAVDDAQYGMKGLANNIQPLLMAFGVGAGLAGIIGIVVTATTVLTDKWGKLMDAMGMGKVKTQAEEMKALADQVERTVEQQRKLDEYERQKAAGEKVKSLPKAQQEAIAAGQTAIIEAGGSDRLAAGIRGVRETGPGGVNPHAVGFEEYMRQKERFDNPERFVVAGHSNKDELAKIKAAAAAKMDQLKIKNQDESKAQALSLIDKAANGDQNAYKTLVGMIRANPGAFPPDALREIEKGTPQGQHDAKLRTIVGDMGQDIAKEQAGFRKEVEWKQSKMEEGEKTIQRSQDARRQNIDWKNSKMDEVNADISKANARQQEVQDYFNEIKPGPDAETQAFLNKRQAASNEMNGSALDRRRQGIENLGGTQQAFNDLAAGLMMQGMSPEQAKRVVQGQANRTIGTIPGIDVTRQAVSSAQGAMFSMQAEQMMRSLGPRQVHQGFASFTDSVTSADPLTNTMRAQVEASNKANVILDQIRQAVSTRTFRAAAS